MEFAIREKEGHRSDAVSEFRYDQNSLYIFYVLI